MLENDEPRLYGPEFKQSKGYIKSFPLLVTVFDGTKLLRQEEINYSDKEHRNFIGRITVWACGKGYEVRTKKNGEIVYAE